MTLPAVQPDPESEAGLAKPRGRVTRGLVRGHWVFGLLLLAGALVRAGTMYAYWPAFWFRNDSRGYIAGSAHPQPQGFGGANGVGYPAFVWLMRWTDRLGVVSIVQHLIGLALAVLIYAFLRRRGLPGWLAALGAAPQLLDSRVIAVEHYVLADSLFTALITTAALLLLWRDRPSVPACVSSAVLLVAGILTRTVGLGLVAVFLLYLLLRWVGWARLVAFLLPVLLLLGGYLGWMHSVIGSYSFSRMQGQYLYSRTAQIADCTELQLTAAQRAFCPTIPLDQRVPRGDWFLWNGPKIGIQHYTPQQAAAMRAFAKKVITQQPGDYLALLARDTANYLVPGQHADPWSVCVGDWWGLPAQLQSTVSLGGRCKALLTYTDFNKDPVWPAIGGPSTSRTLLNWYSNHIRLPHTALGITVLLGLAALAWRRRRPGWRHDLPAALLVGSGLALLLLAVATSEYSVRYGIPSITLMTAGAALALYRLSGLRGSRGDDPT